MGLAQQLPDGDPPGPTLRPPLAERKAEVTPSPSLTVEPCSQPAVGRGGLVLTSTALRITSCLGTTCSSRDGHLSRGRFPGSPGEPQEGSGGPRDAGPPLPPPSSPGECWQQPLEAVLLETPPGRTPHGVSAPSCPQEEMVHRGVSNHTGRGERCKLSHNCSE